MSCIVLDTFQPYWTHSQEELHEFSHKFHCLFQEYFQNPSKTVYDKKNVCNDVVLDALVKNLYGIDTKELSRIHHFTKLLQMQSGKFIQEMLGLFPGWKSLGQGHPSGLDLYNKFSNTFVELKNRHNTDNASSRSANLQKLAYQQKNNCNVIYGVVNDKSSQGIVKLIPFKGSEIKYMSGDFLFEEITKIKNFSNLLSRVLNLLTHMPPETASNSLLNDTTTSLEQHFQSVCID